MISIAVLLSAAALMAGQASAPDPDQPAIDAADLAIAAGRAEQAIATLDPVIARHDAAIGKERRHVYCAVTTTEALLTSALPDREKKGSVTLGPRFCTALFLKGFALFDLNRVMEARAVYQRLVALAPFHAQYQAELGQTYRLTQDWSKMLSICTNAAAVADLVGGEQQRVQKRQAWRCMGYALTEQGRLDEAEQRYRDCLTMDPGDAVARHELDYLAEQKARMDRPGTR